MLQAHELYQEDASTLTGEQYSRVGLALSTLFRKHRKDTTQAKKWLEIAKDKITDRRVLLQFY